MKIERNGIVYTTHNGKAVVEGLSSCKNKDIVIPDIVEDCIVESIADGAFFGIDIKSIILPYSITKIGERAFALCENLETVLHGSLKNSFLGQSLKIEDSAFAGCENLKRFNMAKYLNLYNCCFALCHSLRNIDAVDIAVGEVFKNCNNLSCVTFMENCDLTNFIDNESRIKKYNFLGNANLAADLSTSIKKQGILIECYVDSNVCELAYEGIPVYAIDSPF